MKTLATENVHSKLENNQLQIENPDDTENKIKIDKMKQNIIRELAKVTNTDMKDREPLKMKNDKKKTNVDKGGKLCYQRFPKLN